MDNVIAKVEQEDLGGGEIKSMLNGVADIKTYNQLQGATMESFFTKPVIALLFPVQSLQSGHWLGIWVDAATRVVHHFDSYGLSPAAENSYTSNALAKQDQLLAKFYTHCSQRGYQVHYNTTRFQEMTSGVNTCGRHVISRLRLRYLDDSQYTQLLLRQKMNPDDIVTFFTFLALNEDGKDKAKILEMFK